jgi:hypothetical protein
MVVLSHRLNTFCPSFEVSLKKEKICKDGYYLFVQTHLDKIHFASFLSSVAYFLHVEFNRHPKTELDINVMYKLVLAPLRI